MPIEERSEVEVNPLIFSIQFKYGGNKLWILKII